MDSVKPRRPVTSILATLTIYLLFAESSSTCQTGHVTQYVLAFLAPGPPLVTSSDELQVQLVLINPSNTIPVGISVEPIGRSLSLQPGAVSFDVLLDGSAALIGSEKQAMGGGVAVTACSSEEAGLVVVGTVRTEGSKIRANAAFSVPSVTSLGVEYFLVTHCEQNHCCVGIVATEPDTQVRVTLRLRHSNDVSISPTLTYSGVTFHDGDVVEESLDQFQAMQILCHECDMSGSHVNASLPVAVLTGAELTSVSNTSTTTDSLLEFLPPRDILGTRHVVATDTKNRFVLKVVAIQKGTVFTLLSRGECYRAEMDGDTWTLAMPQPNNPTVLESTHPVLVSLLISKDAQDTGDARMTVLLPVSQWNNVSYEVVQPFNTDTNRLVLVADSSSILAGCLKMDGDDVSAVSGYSQYGAVDGESELIVVGVPLDAGPHHLHLSCDSSCSTCTSFWGYVHGERNNKRGWAMPLGTFTRMSSLETGGNQATSLCSHLVPSAVSSETVATSTIVATSAVETTPVTIAPSSVTDGDSPLHTPSKTFASDEHLQTSSVGLVSSSDELDHHAMASLEMTQSVPVTVLDASQRTTVDRQTSSELWLRTTEHLQSLGEDVLVSSDEHSKTTALFETLPSAQWQSTVSQTSAADQLFKISDELSSPDNSHQTFSDNILFSDDVLFSSDEDLQMTLLLGTTQSVMPATPLLTLMSATSSQSVTADLLSQSIVGVTSLQITPTSSLSTTEMSAKLVSEVPVPCKCLCRHRFFLQENITLPVDDDILLSQTSRQRNRKQSAPDQRVSATLIGSGGVFLLVGVLLFIVGSDLINLLVLFNVMSRR